MKPYVKTGRLLAVALIALPALSGCVNQPTTPAQPDSPYGSPYGAPGYGGGGYADPYYGAPAVGGGWQVMPNYGSSYQSREAWEMERQRQELERERKLLEAERRKLERKEDEIERKRDRERQAEIGHRNPNPPPAKSSKENCSQDRNTPAGKKNSCN